MTESKEKFEGGASSKEHKEKGGLIIARKLADGYTLTPDGRWVSSQYGRVTHGGNVNVENMKASLDASRLEALAKNEGVMMTELLPMVVEAARFVGAYEIQEEVRPYEYQGDEGTPSDDHIKEQLDTARRIFEK